MNGDLKYLSTTVSFYDNTQMINKQNESELKNGYSLFNGARVYIKAATY